MNPGETNLKHPVLCILINGTDDLYFYFICNIRKIKLKNPKKIKIKWNKIHKTLRCW